MLSGKTLLLWRQAWPIILANATTPLLGLVGTALLGHLPDSSYLGAVALGAVVFSFLYWGLGFLRMGTTGLVAQAFGVKDSAALGRLISQALILALVLGVALQALRPALPTLLSWLKASDTLSSLATEYISIRLASAPAVLVQYVVLGVALGIAKSRIVLGLTLVANTVNLSLSLVLVLILGWKSAGVAWASLIAELATGLLGLIWLYYTSKKLQFTWCWPPLGFKALRTLLRVNSDLFIRTLALLLVLAFFARQGAAQGQDLLAANALLMQLVMLASYLLDGFAQAVEGQFGAAWARSRKEGWLVIKAGAILSLATGLGLTLALLVSGEILIARLTDVAAVKELALHYLPWLYLLLPLSVATYLLDGVFIGATWTQAMRNSLLLAALGFGIVWWLTQAWANHGLWLAFIVFNTLRGLSLGWVLAQHKPN